jgi:hypothetical protein
MKKVTRKMSLSFDGKSTEITLVIETKSDFIDDKVLDKVMSSIHRSLGDESKVALKLV